MTDPDAGDKTSTRRLSIWDKAFVLGCGTTLIGAVVFTIFTLMSPGVAFESLDRRSGRVIAARLVAGRPNQVRIEWTQPGPELIVHEVSWLDGGSDRILTGVRAGDPITAWLVPSGLERNSVWQLYRGDKAVFLYSDKVRASTRALGRQRLVFGAMLGVGFVVATAGAVGRRLTEPGLA
jgi:hypothetical protein